MVVRIGRAPGWRIGLIFALGVALAACGGVPEATQRPPATPTNAPTPAPDCPDPTKAQQVAKQFFVALNARDTATAFSLLAPTLRRYDDVIGDFHESGQKLDNVRGHLERLAKLSDRFSLGEITSKLEPSPVLVEYYVEIAGVTRTNDDLTREGQVARGTISLNVHCDTLKIGILAIITFPENKN